MGVVIRLASVSLKNILKFNNDLNQLPFCALYISLLVVDFFIFHLQLPASPQDHSDMHQNFDEPSRRP